MIFSLLAFVHLAVGQGVTTSTLSGRVTTAKAGAAEETLPGANVVAVHVPSGTTYGTVTGADGKFMIPGMRVGGPYTLKVSFVGFRESVVTEITLNLGITRNINVALVEESQSLEELVISGERGVFSTERTGAATNLNNRVIQSVPTISRGLRDFTKLSPLANTSGNGTSFAGSSNRYNQFAIDGLVSNDVFGLAGSGTNGGQTGVEPISLDAIEEFQLNIAPYDIRQGGFTGGGINAVTRSGSNTFQGSAYFFGNNQTLVGKTNPNSGVEADYPDYKDYQAGFRIGGPIIKNKLFFFVNGEIARQKTPIAFMPGSPESNVTVAEMNRVRTVLNTLAPDYDPGSFGSLADETNSNKFLAKVDWNISQQHKLTVRHSYTYGEQIDQTRSANQARFSNSGIYFPSTTNSTGVELNSIFGTVASNRLLVGYTTVRDDREPLGSPFPWTVINLADAPQGRSIIFGSENSSVGNQLDQDNLSITNDFTIYKGRNVITIGTHNEFYKFYNFFLQNIFGNYAFKTLENFESQTSVTPVAPTFYQIGYSFDANDGNLQKGGGAKFNAMQLGLYVQDEIQALENLKVTAGLRVDLPLFPDSPEANEAFNATYGSLGKTGTLPETKLLIAPRIGFNLDVFKNRSLQIRGGAGVFTGRVPFVWVSNQFSNNGQLNGTYSTGNSSASGNPLTNGLVYSANPFSQPFPGQAPIASANPGRGAINVIDKNFRFPQVFRTNLAVDKKLPWGLTATIEGIFSKTYNNINYTNLNRQEQAGFTFTGPDTRPRYTTTSTSPTVSGYNQAARINSGFEEILLLSNTNEGYTYNLVAQLQKDFIGGFTGSIAYSYGDAYDLNSGTSSTALSNWRFVSNVGGLNDLGVTRSNYSAGSRVVGLVSYRLNYLKDMMSTQVSLFYNGQSGQPFSYRYAGDMNYDGTDNDLIFIPKVASDINLITIPAAGTNPAVTPEEQWEKLDAFIKADDYLNSRRGKYAERNGARTPFQQQFDLRIMHEFAIKVGKTTNKLQLTFDIINVGNLINKDWGKQYFVANQEFGLISYRGLRDDDATSGVNYSANAPTYQYSPPLTKGKPWTASDLSSRWRGQFGIRYIFN